MPKIAVIEHCGDCPYFNNYELDEECWMLRRHIDRVEGTSVDGEDNDTYPIPEDCPLEEYYEKPYIDPNLVEGSMLQMVKKWYYDLIECVESKYEGETRHQTAKRYIMAGILHSGDQGSKEEMNDKDI